MADITIDGKTVVLRDSIPAAAAYRILACLFEIEPGESICGAIPFPDAKFMVQEAVESWELEGDPHSDAFYESLTPPQLTDFFMPLVVQVYVHFAALVKTTGEASGE